MLSKMPWLVSRRRLLIIGIIDYLIINLIFFILQINKIINTNILAINLLSFCWIISSYTLDKYSIVDDEYNFNSLNNFLRTIKISILSGLLFKIVIIIFSIFKSNVGDGKWPFFLILICLTSFLYELFHSYIIKNYLSKPIKWISIFSNSEFGTLFKDTSKISKYGYLKSININNLNELIGLNVNEYGLILEDINLLTNEEKKILINLKNEGFKILSLELA